MPLIGITRLFKRHSVAVCGEKGSGKDMLFSNVVVRRGRPYVSNVDYPARGRQPRNLIRFPLDLEALNTGNTYRNFLAQNLQRYMYRYPDGTDIYISDAGIYFPAQYSGILDRDYAHFPTFEALSRHLGGLIHYNCQDVNRVWNKIREQCNRYIRCTRCIVLFKGKLVLQRVVLYDRIDSCASRIEPCSTRVPLFNAQARQIALAVRENYRNTHGLVQARWLLYRNRSSYDTRAYRSKLERGVDD